MSGKTWDDKQHDWALEIFKSTLEAGRIALNVMLLICGGAAVALLTLIGNLAKDGSVGMIGGLASALFWYMVALFFLGVEAGATYMAQFLFAGDSYKKNTTFLTKAGHAFVAIGVLSFLVVLGCFLKGSWVAYQTMVAYAAAHSY